MRGEFARIRDFLAPHAPDPGAFGLTDDAAFLRVAPSAHIVVTTDTLVEGVHFTCGERPADIAYKLLAVNASDLAGKGVWPWRYCLNLSLPSWVGDEWLGAFCEELGRAQEAFGCSLVGGDSVAGPLVLSVTMFGRAPTMLTRGGARVGDKLFVSGTVGDGYLGLQVALGREDLTEDTQPLYRRYLRPTPRLALGRALRELATASTDVSDGLYADVETMATASHVGAVVDLRLLPLSPEARLMMRKGGPSLYTLATGGDDYEIAFTVPSEKVHELRSVSSSTHTPLTEVGYMIEGDSCSILGYEGPVRRKGYEHGAV